MKSKIINKHIWKAFLIFGAASLWAGMPPSAFEARGIAEKQVNAQTQNKVIQMFGAQSKIGLHPTSWRILFWDQTASQNGRVIVVTDGAVSEIKDGFYRVRTSSSRIV